LGIAEREIKRVKTAKFVLIPESADTFGHGTHTHVSDLEQYLAELLEKTRIRASRELKQAATDV